jgi:hypothetical protein
MPKIKLVNETDFITKELRLNSTIRKDRTSPELGTLSSEKFSLVGSISLI